MEQDLLSPDVLGELANTALSNIANTFANRTNAFASESETENGKNAKRESATPPLFSKSVIEPQNALPDELLATSYAIIGKKKSSKSPRDAQRRRQKTFVQKVFLELVQKFSEDDLQSLLYLDFYQELCNGIAPNGANNQS